MTDNEKSAATPTKTPAETGEAPDPITFAEFLEGVPPGQSLDVADLFSNQRTAQGLPFYELRTPDIQLHCTSEECNGLRFFRYKEGDRLTPVGRMGNQSKQTYFTYVCSNCQKGSKIFSILAFIGEKLSTCYKF